MSEIHIYDYAPDIGDSLSELLAGLRQTPSYLSAKFNYDERGAKLYEELCQTTDYYLTRTERAIMQQNMQQISDCLSDTLLIVEYGSGNAQKTRLLFEHLPQVVGYIPVDISREQLIEVSKDIAATYPHIEVLPVWADFNQLADLPLPTRHFERRLFFYPGSTIGHSPPAEAVQLLQQMRAQCQPGDALLIGVDLVKDPALLVRAYDDRDGIIREFSWRNPLQSLNQQFGADFQIEQYRYLARYNAQEGCIEMDLQSRVDQTVHINGEAFTFAAGELIRRAVAYKYSIDAFQALVAQAGWQSEQVWTDDRQWFSVHYCTAIEQA